MNWIAELANKARKEAAKNESSPKVQSDRCFVQTMGVSP